MLKNYTSKNNTLYYILFFLLLAQISWGQGANACVETPDICGEGVCVSDLNAYTCDCPPWSVGDTCDLDMGSWPVATEPNMASTTVLKNTTNVALDDSIKFEWSLGEEKINSVLYFTITGGTITLGTNGITFGGDGNSSASFTAEGLLVDLNLALDQATFTPTTDLIGTDVASISFYGILYFKPKPYSTRVSNVASVSFSIADSTLSVENLNFENNINLYPIPSKDILNIKNTSTDVISKITITDVLGKTLFESNYDNLDSSIKIDVSSITAGIYFISLSKNNYTSIRKIIIN